MFNIIKEYFNIKKYDIKNLIIAHYNHNVRKESFSEQEKLKKKFDKYKFYSSIYK
jgi:hypothetical protein